jgi:hypothetical protein
MKFRPTIFLFASILLHWGCDKLKENPRPVFLIEDAPAHIEIDMLGNDSVSFELFDTTTLGKQITVTVRQPVNGTISPSGATGSFVYTPYPGFVGSDSLVYVYCLGNECKEAKVNIQVFPPCQFSLSPDFFSFPERTSDSISLDVLINDNLGQCVSARISKAWSAEAEILSWANGKIDFKLKPFTTGKVNISYEVCGSFNRCHITDVVVETNPASSYCENRFYTTNDTLVLPNGFYFKIFQPSDLLTNDGFCATSIDLNSFEIIRFPASINGGKLVFQNSAWWYLVNNPQGFQSDNFAYRICSQSGKCDTATVTIAKYW